MLVEKTGTGRIYWARGLGLGRLLGARRLLAEAAAEVAGCADHLLLLGSDDSVRGLGYNRYQQACPGEEALRLAAPTALIAAPFSGERVLHLCAGGGCSMALTEARETLVACCLTTLKAQLEAGDATRCAELLCLAAHCHSPPLAALADVAATCVRRHRPAVQREASRRAVAVDEALAALFEMRAAAGAASGASSDSSSI